MTAFRLEWPSPSPHLESFQKIAVMLSRLEAETVHSIKQPIIIWIWNFENSLKMKLNSQCHISVMYCLWYFYFIWLTTFLCGRKGIRAIGKRCQSCVEAISTLFQFLDTLFLIALTSSPHILQRKKMDSKSFTRINTCRRPIWWIFFKAVKCWKGGFPFEEKRGKSNKSCRPKERSRQRVWPRSHQTNV